MKTPFGAFFILLRGGSAGRLRVGVEGPCERNLRMLGANYPQGVQIL
jgi:hypothetical protein